MKRRAEKKFPMIGKNAGMFFQSLESIFTALSPVFLFVSFVSFVVP